MRMMTTPELEPVPQVVYVAGLMFDAARSRVALMRKLKPLWQMGKLNGIGGKVEPGEEPKSAMVREFREEAGAVTTEEQWTQFLGMDGPDWTCHFFATVGDLDALETMELEPIEVVELISLTPLRGDVIANIPWIVPLALERLATGEPHFAWVQYR